VNRRPLLLLCLLLSASCQAQTPGRLFFSPDERRLLEQEKAHGEATTPPGRLDGVMRSEHGRRTYWVDGQASDATPPAQTVGDSLLQPLLPPGSLHRHHREGWP